MGVLGAPGASVKCPTLDLSSGLDLGVVSESLHWAPS